MYVVLLALNFTSVSGCSTPSATTLLDKSFLTSSIVETSIVPSSELPKNVLAITKTMTPANALNLFFFNISKKFFTITPYSYFLSNVPSKSSRFATWIAASYFVLTKLELA